jgi:hypothetical protein
MRQPHRIAALAFAVLAGVGAGQARAQEASTLVGTYCLVGVMEVGSCLKLGRDGKFEYFLAYGAYDENSEGTWRVEGGRVVLDSPAYDKQPTFTFKRMQKAEGDQYDVIVQTKAGRVVQGIDVSVNCDGRTTRAGVTGAGGFNIACQSAPAQVLLGLGMYGLALQPIDVAGKAGADKAYVFEFDPGDLGRKRFAGHVLTVEGNGVLVTTYANTPIRELEGRTFRFTRQ